MSPRFMTVGKSIKDSFVISLCRAHEQLGQLLQIILQNETERAVSVHQSFQTSFPFIITFRTVSSNVLLTLTPSHLDGNAIHIGGPSIRIGKRNVVVRTRYESVQAKQISVEHDIPALHKSFGQSPPVSFQRDSHQHTCPDIGIFTSTGVPPFTLTSARLQFEHAVLEKV